ncbi:hypothetical protein HPB51_026340 [Rhipicephalus microplus]|uniref:Uncharacterized protein n=1 Tax=Rhipicephalus microplus TaxID=6941 RepID=A0A9J6D3A0_RHIMP|nr:hypothetical protein HPB51_026340 [Rhipicephalus microplus]
MALNATLMLFKARSLQKFFYKSHKYEQRVRFVAPKNGLKATNACYLIRFLLLAAFLANVCTNSYLSLEFVDKLACGPVLGATLKVTCIAGNLVFYVLDAAPFLVVRPCCEVMRLYIKHQHEVLRFIVRSGGNEYVGAERRARLVEYVRLNLDAISRIKRSLNETWQHAIAVSGAMVLWASCSGIYLNFFEAFWTVEHVLSITYTVSAVLDFLDIAILSDALARELRRKEIYAQQHISRRHAGNRSADTFCWCFRFLIMLHYDDMPSFEASSVVDSSVNGLRLLCDFVRIVTNAYKTPYEFLWESFLVAETLILGWKLDLGRTPLQRGGPGESLVPGSSPGAGLMYRQ